MRTVLLECADRAAARWLPLGRRIDTARGAQRGARDALSCYESGSFVQGWRNGYVQRVVRAAAAAQGMGTWADLRPLCPRSDPSGSTPSAPACPSALPQPSVAHAPAPCSYRP